MSNCERRFLLRAIEEKKVNWEFSAASAVGLQAARSLPAWMLGLSSLRPWEPQEEPLVLPPNRLYLFGSGGVFSRLGSCQQLSVPGHLVSTLPCGVVSITLISKSLARGLPAAAKSLQSCPTLCDPMDCSLPGSSVHEIFQARVLEWVAIAFSAGPA